MGKVQKKATDKHKLSLSPALTEFIEKATTVPLAQLPSHLESIPARWPFPRGDLYNWIAPLDRFDEILQNFIRLYGLSDGPQIKKFGVELLLEGAEAVARDDLSSLGFGDEGDRQLVESVLSFSRLLLEKCGNRTLYNSTERLNELLNTTSLSLLHKTLRLTLFLAQRFGSRPPQQQFHVQFYHYDLDRLLKLAGPLSNFAARRPPQSPVKSARSKDKNSQPQPRRASLTVSPNDFCALAQDEDAAASPSGLDQEWSAWANVRVVWSNTNSSDQSQRNDQILEQATPDSPTSPSPLRRANTDQHSVVTSPTRAPLTRVASSIGKSGLQQLDVSASDLVHSDIQDILRNVPADMPANSRYELLHKLRIAYGLLSSSETRKLLLQNRLTALSILGHVYSDDEFSHKYFDSDANPAARQQLIQQIVSLLRDPKKGQLPTSMYLQTLAMEALGILSRQRTLAFEILAALAPNSSHGLLNTLVKKGVADIAQDGDATDNEAGDDWREAIFNLYTVFMGATSPHHSRSSESYVHGSLITAYASGLRIVTEKSLRIHLRILDFMKNFFHHFRDGLQALTAGGAFETACECLQKLSHQALDFHEEGQGIPAQYKTQVTDYKIPYMHQQVIRSLIDLVNDIPSHQGNHADRALRGLVDSSALLSALRLILSNMEAFGAHTWSEVVKAICSFLNNEPTSFTVISEAGIITTLLQTVQPHPETSAAPANGEKKVQTLSAKPSGSALALPPITDAILNLASAFSPICLTESGHKQFIESGVLSKFFEIFESPAHVVAIKDSNTLNMLGSTFDELSRHHPSLKDLVMSAVITMLARVRYICNSFSWKIGAGPKMWNQSKSGALEVSGGVEGLLTEIAPGIGQSEIDFEPFTLPDGNVLNSIRPDDAEKQLLGVEASDKDSDGMTMLDYARPAIGFLIGFFDNHSQCKDFMAAGAVDFVLDFLSLPSFPVMEDSFSSTGPINELPTLIHMMAEDKPHLILPALTDRACYAVQGLETFTQYNPGHVQCFFEPYLKHETAETTMDIDMPTVQDGTRAVKCLMAVYTNMKVLSDVFGVSLYHSRPPTKTLIHLVNLTDMLSGLVRSLGQLSASCCREEISLQSLVPSSWLHATKPGHFSSGDHDVDIILGVSDDRPAEDFNTTISSEALRPGSHRAESLTQAKSTAAFRNCQTLRYLLNEVPSSINDFILRLGCSFPQKKKPMDTYEKAKVLAIAESIAFAWTTQLEPPFLDTAFLHDDNTLAQEWRFMYFDVVLQNVRNSSFDDNPSAGNSSAKQTFIVDIFRKIGGMRMLTRIGTEFFDELKSCKVARAIFAANTGLKLVLELFDDLTHSTNIVNSAQAIYLKVTETSKPTHFNPQQVLLELRMEALELTRRIWDSEYAEQASADVVEKLINILKYTLAGDSEADAVKTSSDFPKVPALPQRKYVIDPSKLASLQERGFEQQLAQEALYRCNTNGSSNIHSAEEYCKAVAANPRRRRLPPPEHDLENKSAASTAPPNLSNNGQAPSTTSPSGPTTMVSERRTSDSQAQGVARGSADSEMTDVTISTENDLPSRSDSQQAHGLATMNISAILNTAETSEPAKEDVKKRYSVQDMNAAREAIREDLAERCNNVLLHHQTLLFDINDLLSVATQQLSEEAGKSWWEGAAALLVMALISSNVEEESTSSQKASGLAAIAQLIGLLSGGEYFKSTILKVVQEYFDQILDFLALPVSLDNLKNDSFPWIASILLIVEKVLTLECEPTEVHWSSPNDLEPAAAPRMEHKSIVSLEQKKEILRRVLAVLHRVGKDGKMAVAIVRVLVILTRDREIALILGEKQNLQKLFLMAKQLSGHVSGRFESSFMIVLRHVIEDDDTIKQIMRSEILSYFQTRGHSRPLDLTTYARELYPLALRSPSLFVETSNKIIKIASWNSNSQPASMHLMLREDATPAKQVTTGGPSAAMLTAPQSDVPTTSVEQPTGASNTNKGKTTEVRPPVVEHPDGIIHFLLSQLLTYKDVDEGEGPSTIANSGEQTSGQDEEVTSDGQNQATEATTPTKPDKPRFQAEDHPIFMYRCFLMHCLVELLYSYNQTKIEFINFSRKADPLAATPSKPRSGVLNYLLHAVIPSGYVDKDDTIVCKKKIALSEWAMKLVVALCSKTGETAPAAQTNHRYASQEGSQDEDNEPDLTFVRRFVLEHAIKAFRDASTSQDTVQVRYGRLLCLADLFHKLMSKPSGSDRPSVNHNTSYKVLARMMFEKNLISILTAAISDIDLAFPSAKKVIKFILRPLQELTNTATTLSQKSPEALTALMGNQEADVISSASDMSEADDDREETPDLFRNSALGMLDPDRADGSDTSDEEDAEDDEMYEMDYEDEMDMEEPVGVAVNDGEVVSDEELEESDEVDGIEGMPGDVPMDIEFVMGPDGRVVDGDDEDDSSEDDEDDSEEDDDDDIEIEMDDEGDHGSISQGSMDDEDGEDGWEDEDDDADEDEDEEIQEGIHHHDQAFEADDLAIPTEIADGQTAHFNNLLRVLGEVDGDGPDPAIINDDDDQEDDDDEEEGDDDEGEDGEGMDDVGWHEGFDMMLDGPDDMDENDALSWDEPPQPIFRRHRHRGGTVPGFFSRRMFNEHDLPVHHSHSMGPRHNRHPIPGRGSGADDGVNPLMQRPEPPMSDPHPGLNIPTGAMELQLNVPINGGSMIVPFAQGQDIAMGMNRSATTSHGAVLDAIMGAIQRQGVLDPDFPHGGRLQFNVTGPGDLQNFTRIAALPGPVPSRQPREDPGRSVQFVPAMTNSRWHEEARMLFAQQCLEKVRYVQIWLTATLFPLAQEEEKGRRKQREEQKKADEKRIAEERAAAEERRRKAEEERLVREAAEAEAAAQEAARVAAEEAEAQQAREAAAAAREADAIERMEGVQSAQTDEAEEQATGQPSTAPRRYFTIRGRQLDITDLEIDEEYLSALPEDLQQDVIMDQYRTRQEQQAQDDPNEASGFDPEFLEALPEDLRAELQAQQAQIQRRRDREQARRESQANGGLQLGDMEPDDFLASLDPALRRVILAEQPPEILETLSAQHAAEGQRHRNVFMQHHRLPFDSARGDDRRRENAQREQKRQVVQLIDKAGVATLLRLMFLQQQGSLKASLFHVLAHVCGNRQTRFEVVSLLLVILREGSTDVTAVERSLASLSLRAKATDPQKTPQALKRTLSTQPYPGVSEDMTPILVVQQCLNALSHICRQSSHVRAIFLREVDVTSAPVIKGKGKNKSRDNRTKFPINDLLSLLDRTLIMESSTCLHSLASLLATITQTLPLLIRQEKERVEAEKAKKEKAQKDAQAALEEQSTTKTATGENKDTPMEDSNEAAPSTTTGEASNAAAANQDAEDQDNADQEKKKPFEPPIISEHNLKLITSIFVAQECGNETFRYTLETLESLAANIPGTSAVFGQELIRHVQNLSQQICHDLEGLLPAIKDAQSSTDVQGLAAAKFSASTSDQVKLLRVLQALDYLSAPKKEGDVDDKAGKTTSVLTVSYGTLSLGPLWHQLSECLTAVEEKGDTISFANILLPLIESLMVVCKNTTLKDAPLSQQVKEGEITSSPVEGLNDLEELFFKFTTEHRKILNDIVRQSPKLMQGPFSILVKNSKVLDFDNKRNYFNKQIHSRHHAVRHPQPPLQLNIRRDQVFIDSYKSLYFKTAEEMKYGKLNIRFNGEEGVDAGGVTREWFQVLARGMFDPNYALFHPVASDRTTFHPSTLSSVNPEHLLYFKFVGRIIGKALHEGRVLDCHFSRAVYKRILGKSPNLKDLESNDVDYYKSLVWILENDITDVLTEEFCVIESEFGESRTVDLIENGRDISVTEENKKEYVQKLVEYRLTESVKEQLDHFLIGFHDIIPAELIAIFNEQELELLISGLPEIDVDDWRANTEYHNYNPSSQQVVWFWRIVKAMSNEERAKLLQFITGTSKVPLNGFKELEGVSGLTRCNIHKDPSTTRLPTSHTCFNQLDLPAYESFETMKHNLMTAINLGADYFGFA